MVKKILLGILAFIILLIPVGFFLPDKIEIAKDIGITAPIEYVFEEITELERWTDWSYRQAVDPAMQITYGNFKSGTRASMSWKNKNDSVVLKITESLPDTSLVTETYFTKTDTARSYYKLKHKGDTILLTATYRRNNFENPFSRWKAFLFITPKVKKALGYELEKIKEIAEAKPIFTIKITEESLAPTYYISDLHLVDGKSDIAQMKNILEELHGVAKNAKVSSIGHPFGLYSEHSTIKVNYAIPFSPPDIKFPSEFPVLQHYSGAVIKGVHIGGYEKLKNAHEQVRDYINYKKFKINGYPWEVYVRGPHNERESSQWITEVYYPVK